MAYTKLGRIRPVYKGTWSASAAYTALEMVKSADGGTAYIAVKDVPKGTALTNAAYWGVVLDVSDVLAAADEAIAAAVARADEAAASANEAAALAPKPLELTESAQPAQIWPEAGSPLRPVISMLPAQTGSGDSSPENVRPISGHAAVMVTRCGKNLISPSIFAYGEPFFNSDGTTQTSTAVGVCYIPIEAGKTYTITAYSQHYIRVAQLDNNKAFIPGVRFALQGAENGSSKTFTTTKNTAYLQIAQDKSLAKAQLEEGETATAYEAYGDTFTFALGDTYYGGILDAAKGELVVDTCGIVFNGTENISLQENYNNTGTNRFSYAGTPVPVQESAALCSHMTFGYSPLGANDINNCIAVWKNGGLYWRFDRCATESEMKAYFTEQYSMGRPVQVVYALAEPYTVKLAPVTIPALGGLNIVYSTGESMTLTYNKSLVREHGEIMARLAALEAAALGNT